MSVTPLDAARGAKSKALKVFGRLAEVVGVGITRVDGSYGLKVNLRDELPRGTAAPRSIDGVPIVVEVVGRIRAR
jgi:hypothetical protein